jgi:hypothetical protein
MKSMPARYSLVSANGPSLSRTSSPWTRTVVASVEGRSRAPPFTTPLVRTSSMYEVKRGSSAISSGLSSSPPTGVQMNITYFMQIGHSPALFGRVVQVVTVNSSIRGRSCRPAGR